MHTLAIDLAKYLIVVPALAAAYTLFLKIDKKHRVEYLSVLVFGGLLSLLIAKVGAHFYNDPRPFLKDGVTPLFYSARDNGFPSDHTLLSAFVGFATIFYSLRLGLGLLVVAAIVGWARVYSGVHHLTDIIGSFVFAALGAWLAHWIVGSRLKKHRGAGAAKTQP